MVQNFWTHLSFFFPLDTYSCTNFNNTAKEHRDIVIKTHKSSQKLNYVKHIKQNEIKVLLAHNIWVPYVYELAPLVAEDALPNNTDE